MGYGRGVVRLVKKRKPRPQPPKYYWWDTDNCYFCKNRNGCSGCRILVKYNKKN